MDQYNHKPANYKITQMHMHVNAGTYSNDKS